MCSVSLAFQCVNGCSDERGGNGDGGEGSEIMEERRDLNLPGLLHEGFLVLCGKLEQGLKVMVERFVEVCKRSGLKVNGDKRKVMVLGREDGLECDIRVDKA